MKSAAKKGSVAAASVVTLLTITPGSSDATNFGSARSESGAASIKLGDSAIQEFSIWGSGLNSNLIRDAVEFFYEPTDLSVARAAPNTEQDVIFVAAPGSGVFRALCRTDVAAIYGQHHHRVCDKKKVQIDTDMWSGWTNAERKYVVAHEFGHAVGLRHSNSSSYGTNENGDNVANTHPDRTGTVMFTGGFGEYTLHAHDVEHINTHY